MADVFILGIESSCDETAAAVVRSGEHMESNVVLSQFAIHQPYGGVVPELASREHLRGIVPVVRRALEEARQSYESIDAIAVTQGPGLAGALLVGVTYAKALAFSLEKPLIAVNHLEGHIHAVLLEERQRGHRDFDFPVLALVVSGGHTHLYLAEQKTKAAGWRYTNVGRTRDDAAGEAYDKVAKLLGLGYPGGPVIDRLAKQGDARAAELVFTIPRMDSMRLDFSFSGLKTAVLRYVREQQIEPLPEGEAPGEVIINLVTSFQDKVIRSLLARVREAVRRHQPQTIILAGGVACNSALRQSLKAAGFDAPVYYPSPILTTDNAAMIAAAGYPKLRRGEDHGLAFTASTSIKLENLQLAGYDVPVNARYRI
ncbi:MAG TPA: tRNA (adenosine(37)-N6)-threonylcarbamoyltransferase complex transferase subunit TsaD [Blastocatellia bacterium]